MGNEILEILKEFENTKKENERLKQLLKKIIKELKPYGIGGMSSDDARKLIKKIRKTIGEEYGK